MRQLWKKGNGFRAFCLSVVGVFAATVMTADMLRQDVVRATVLNLPQPSEMVYPGKRRDMPVLQGLRVDPVNPLNISFIIDQALENDVSRQDASRMISYFLAGLTVPDEDLWVNLSPDEEDRVLAQGLETTELGRDLLAQDYLLKQLASSLTHPDTPTGEAYWRVENGKSTIENRLGKIWIVPDTAEVYEQGTTVVITDASLKLQCEDPSQQVLLPTITKDVNEGKNFAKLRQIYHSLILAKWFKTKLKDSLYAAYIDAHKLKGIDTSAPDLKEKIFALYVESFKKGVYDTIRSDSASDQFSILDSQFSKNRRRRFFSGGAFFGNYTLSFSSSTLSLADKKVLELKVGLMPVPASGSSALVERDGVDEQFTVPQMTIDWQGMKPIVRRMLTKNIFDPAVLEEEKRYFRSIDGLVATSEAEREIDGLIAELRKEGVMNPHIKLTVNKRGDLELHDDSNGADNIFLIQKEMRLNLNRGPDKKGGIASGFVVKLDRRNREGKGKDRRSSQASYSGLERRVRQRRTDESPLPGPVRFVRQVSVQDNFAHFYSEVRGYFMQQLFSGQEGAVELYGMGIAEVPEEYILKQRFATPFIRQKKKKHHFLFMVAEYKGDSLYDYVYNYGLRFTVDETIRIMRPVLRQLAVAHSKDIVHQDIKLENIVMDTIDAGGCPIDFSTANIGGAALLNGHPYTPLYVAPELGLLLEADDPEQPVYTREAEVYALGLVLYQMLTGHPAEGDGAQFQKLKSRPEEVVRAANAIRTNRKTLAAALKEIPEVLRPLLARMLDPDPLLRPSVQEVLFELGRIQQNYRFLGDRGSGRILNERRRMLSALARQLNDRYRQMEKIKKRYISRAKSFDKDFVELDMRRLDSRMRTIDDAMKRVETMTALEGLILMQLTENNLSRRSSSGIVNGGVDLKGIDIAVHGRSTVTHPGGGDQFFCDGMTFVLPAGSTRTSVGEWLSSGQ